MLWPHLFYLGNLLCYMESELIVYVPQHLEKMQLWPTAISPVTKAERFYQLSSWKPPFLHCKCETSFEFIALPLFFAFMILRDCQAVFTLLDVFHYFSITNLSYPHILRTTKLTCAGLFLPTHHYPAVTLNIAFLCRYGHKRPMLTVQYKRLLINAAHEHPVQFSRK